MGDRLDIDALLIGALYGELDGDDRARLDAHLASHPADRAALDALRSTRSLLVEHGAREFLGRAEPTSAISARLMQEASRRAPVPRKAAGGVFGFLAGLLRPVAAHPALSAAAVALLVVGTGSLLMKDGAIQVTQPRVAQPAAQPQVAPTLAAPAAVPPADAPAVAPAPPATEGLAVTLDDGENQEREAPGRAAGDTKERAPERKGIAKPTSGVTRGASRDSRADAFLEVDKRPMTEELPLRKLDDSAADGADGMADEDRNAIAGQGQAVTGAVAAAPTAPPAASADLGKSAAPASSAIDAWAREQHTRMVKFVTAGRCTEAGQIGAEIARRAPDYYQSVVVNDRAVRQCQAYVDRARRAKMPASKPKAENTPAPDEQAH